MSTPTKRLGIAIDLDQLRALMNEFVATHFGPLADDRYSYEYPFETFLQWLKNRQAPDRNILTFRIEKEADK
jgi:hypothetical protein